jgi:hypothetical protein
MKPFNWTDKAATKIAGAFLTLQSKFARFMNKIAAVIPDNKRKLILISFCGIWGGLSIYLIGAAIFRPDQKQPIYTIEPIHSPEHFDKTGDIITKPTVDEDLYREIQVYKKYMDSTGQTIRPSLLDSINLLEELYKANSKQ